MYLQVTQLKSWEVITESIEEIIRWTLELDELIWSLEGILNKDCPDLEKVMNMLSSRQSSCCHRQKVQCVWKEKKVRLCVTFWTPSCNKISVKYYKRVCDNVCSPCQIIHKASSNDRHVIRELQSSAYTISEIQKGDETETLFKANWGILRICFLSISMFCLDYTIGVAISVAVPWVSPNIMPSSYWWHLDEQQAAFTLWDWNKTFWHG